MRRSLILGLLACVGCNAALGPKQGTTTDAPTGGGADAPDTITDSPVTIDAPACANGRVVYLNFDGVALTDSGVSDATLNRASWMQIASGTAPPFRSGEANRLTDIQTITEGVRTSLTEFPVTVVTQRPATGPYVMIVFGGTGQQVGSLTFGFAVNELDCGDVNKSDVAWISNGDRGGGARFTLQEIVNVAVGAIGFGLGLTATNDPNDCMCAWDNVCTPTQTACTLSANIARDPDANQLCAGLTTQNEKMAFEQAFCQ